MSYKFLTDVAIADTAFEATGNNLTELFQSSAVALITTLAEPKTVKPLLARVIELKADTVDKLLFNFLDELVYLKDTDAMVFSKVTVTVDEKKLTLIATVKGDTVKPSEQKLGQDIKAVTMHYFTVEKKTNGWSARVVLDI